MERKIKRIEELFVRWEAKIDLKTLGSTMSVHNDGVCLGLGLALGILKEPPNTQMHMDAKCYCETAIPGDWPCKVCMDEYYKTRR